NYDRLPPSLADSARSLRRIFGERSYWPQTAKGLCDRSSAHRNPYSLPSRREDLVPVSLAHHALRGESGNLDLDRQFPCRLRSAARPAHHDHAARGHRRRLPHPYLLRRIHGSRRGVLAILRLPESLHVLHAYACALGELPADVRGLGGRGSRIVSAHRLLLPA